MDSHARTPSFNVNVLTQEVLRGIVMRLMCSHLSVSCGKAFLISLNALCIITAVGTLAITVVDLRILKQYGTERATGTVSSDALIIMTCILLTAVATLGIIGVVMQRIKLLYLYVGLLMILVLLELLIACYVSVQRYGLEIRVTDWMRDNFFANITDEQIDAHNQMWDHMQTNYECCGLNGPEDYSAVKKEISLSCCSRAYKARTTYAQKQLYDVCIESKSYYSDGCEEEVLYALQESADCLLGVAVMCFWFETLGMLLAMCVTNNLKRNIVKQVVQNVKY